MGSLLNLAHKNEISRGCRLLYEGPPANKSPGVNKPPPPGGPRGGPEEGGERYQHFEEIVGALRAQIFRSELTHTVFQRFFDVFASDASKSG